MAIDDLRGVRKEQSSWRIVIYNSGEFIRARLLPFAKWVIVYLLVSSAVSLCFAFAYLDACRHFLEPIGFQPPNLSGMLKDSFMIFSSLQIFTDTGQPCFLLPESYSDASELDAAASQAFNGLAEETSFLMLVEKVSGLITNAVLIAVITSIAMQPLNPIWLAPRLVFDTEFPDGGALGFRYWIRYPEDKWLHRMVLTVRILSDRADRAIENKDETYFEVKFRRIMRRGVCEYHISLKDGEGKLLSVLSKMAVRHYGKPGRKYHIWEYASGSPKEYGADELEEYTNLQINFRVAGTTSDSREVAAEKKYTIDDLLYGYAFIPVEVPVNWAEITHPTVIGFPGARPRRYRFFYRNIWKVASANPRDAVYRHPGQDMTKLRCGELHQQDLLEKLEWLAKEFSEGRGGHPPAPTIES